MCSCDNSTCQPTTGYVTCYSNCGGATGTQVSSILAPVCGQGYATNFPNPNIPSCGASG